MRVYPPKKFFSKIHRDKTYGKSIEMMGKCGLS